MADIFISYNREDQGVARRYAEATTPVAARVVGRIEGSFEVDRLDTDSPLGNLIAEEGAATLGMLVLNDAYGTGLAGAAGGVSARRGLHQAAGERPRLSGPFSLAARASTRMHG